jgi:hypothetical protein
MFRHPFPRHVAGRTRARDLCQALIATREAVADERRRIIGALLGAGGESVWRQPPFLCARGSNIEPGERVFLAFNCAVPDVCRVRIGSRAVIGAGSVVTRDVPVDITERAAARVAGRKPWTPERQTFSPCFAEAWEGPIAQPNGIVRGPREGACVHSILQCGAVGRRDLSVPRPGTVVFALAARTAGRVVRQPGEPLADALVRPGCRPFGSVTAAPSRCSLHWRPNGP